ncbi:hypothetical protein MOQ72_26935 [Saccharopolyspora sp. K220]|uniref:SCO6880 family protein n=1 Tax=Saccharopolyspora soli TaxID=2926618 RepID=UPI001F55AC0A|nr:SCO6880 family protein [Saccharopolyspora soli]MCI2421084.1 hypothetical protein [Saccharopolyspora soli]
MTATTRRVYRGLGQAERTGWVLGLRPGQAMGVLALAVPVLVTLSAGQFRHAAVLAVLWIVVTCLIVVPVRGRPALRWLGHWLRYQFGVATGWSRWQSRAAAGQPVDPHEPDLPGVLQRLALPDGPPMRDRGRVCLIHDTVDARWGATARLTHTGVGMLSTEECARLASRLGNLLVSLGHREAVDRLTLMVRTVPDDGSDHQVWRCQHESPTAPPLARQATAELDRVLANSAVRHDVFVTVSGPEDKLRKPAAAAGGGVAGRGYVLYRVLEGLEEPLKALGAPTVQWLGGSQLAEALRTGFAPHDSGVLRTTRLTQPGTHGLPMAAAGPTQTPSPSMTRYTHDAYSSVAYTVLMPDTIGFGALSPLLAVRTAGERRSLAVHYEVLDAARAARVVQSNRYRANVLRDVKRGRGFASTAADERQAAGAHTAERAVAAGHAIVRYTVAAAVTVPSHWPVDDHAARLENDAAGQFRLLRLDLAHDSGFVAACLPVGLGLPRQRGGML